VSAPLVVFRCDGGPQIGAGHVTRCLALAEAFEAAGWASAFAVGPDTLKAVPALAVTGLPVVLLDPGVDDAFALRQSFPDGCTLAVIDHYGRDERNERSLRGWAQRILAFDDGTGRRHDCDFLLDSAADDSAYRGLVPEQARLLLGPRYALVRQAFLTRRASALSRRDGREISEVLVSFGATDPWNATVRVLGPITTALPKARITVVLSSAAPHLASLRHEWGAQVDFALDVLDMAAVMERADLAIGASGASSYERAVLGLPTIAVVCADNQKGLSALIVKNGAAIDGGELGDGLPNRLMAILNGLSKHPSRLSRTAQAAAGMVDGLGAGRVIEAAT